MNASGIPFLNHRIYYDVGPPFAAITASTLLGRLSTRFRSVFMGIFDHSSRSAFVRSDRCWSRKPGSHSPLEFIPKVFYRAEASQVLLHQTRSSMSLWPLLCALEFNDLDSWVNAFGNIVYFIYLSKYENWDDYIFAVSISKKSQTLSMSCSARSLSFFYTSYTFRHLMKTKLYWNSRAFCVKILKVQNFHTIKDNSNQTSITRWASLAESS